MPAPSSTFGPLPLGGHLYALGQERALRIDADGPAADKVYWSVRRAGKAWEPTSLPAPHAHAFERALRPVLGPRGSGLARHAAHHATMGTPLHMVQAVMPWDGGACARVKVYHRTDGLPLPALANDAPTLAIPPALRAALGEGWGTELLGWSWPDGTDHEAYSALPVDTDMPASVGRALREAGGEHCQTGLDVGGERTWYFATQGIAFDTAAHALERATGKRIPPATRARLQAWEDAGWVWADLIVQSSPRFGLLPVAHLIDPRPGGRAFLV